MQTRNPIIHCLLISFASHRDANEDNKENWDKQECFLALLEHVPNTYNCVTQIKDADFVYTGEHENQEYAVDHDTFAGVATANVLPDFGWEPEAPDKRED